MTDLHPHWHSTGDDDIVIRPKEHMTADASAQAPEGMKRTVSRRPAAIIGIALVSSIGFLFVGNTELFTGQISIPSSEPVMIVLSADGANPAKVTVSQGQQIIFRNEQDIPNILVSQNLLDQAGSSMNTPAIFPGSEETFQVSSTQEPGTFHYASTTSDINGDIVVVAAANADVSSAAGVNSVSSASVSSVITKTNSSQPAFVIPPAVTSSASSASSSLSSEATITSADPPDRTYLDDLLGTTTNTGLSSQENLIPTNSYTVGGAQSHPFDQYGNPVKNGATHTSAPVNPYPNRQPNSGPEVWFAFLGSGLLFLVLQRRYLHA